MTHEHKTFFNTLITSSGFLGATLGALSAGAKIESSRRNNVMLANLIGMIGVGISFVENVWVISLGRLLFGFGCGNLAVFIPKMIEETVPSNLIAPYGASTNIAIATGSLIPILLSAGFPGETDISNLKKDKFYKLIILFPLFFQIIQLAFFALIYRLEPVKYLVKNNRSQRALRVIRKLYHRSSDH